MISKKSYAMEFNAHINFHFVTSDDPLATYIKKLYFETTFH